jgi:hypothetical protein
MSATDDLKIFLNIMAQSPNGLSDPDLIGKFSRSKATLHAIDSMGELQAQMPPPQPTAPVMQNSPTSSDQTGPISSEPIQNTPEEQGGLNQPPVV